MGNIAEKDLSDSVMTMKLSTPIRVEGDHEIYSDQKSNRFID